MVLPLPQAEQTVAPVVVVKVLTGLRGGGRGGGGEGGGGVSHGQQEQRCVAAAAAGRATRARAQAQHSAPSVAHQGVHRMLPVLLL